MLLNSKVYLLIASSILFLISCDSNEVETKEPTVSVIPKTSETGEVTFQNDSENAASYRWDFGDGESSAEKSPSHTYTFNGTYTIKACATGANNVEVCKETTVTITNAPMIKIFDEMISNTNYQALYTVENDSLKIRVIRKSDDKENSILFSPTIAIDVNQNNKVDSLVDYALSMINTPNKEKITCFSPYLTGNRYLNCAEPYSNVKIVGDHTNLLFSMPLSMVASSYSPDKSKVYISFQIYVFNVTNNFFEARLVLPSGGIGEQWNWRTFEKKYIIKLPTK
jgi:microbial collagenase